MVTLNRKKCRRCGALKIPIMYGFPGPDMMKLAAEGRVKLGGCAVSPTNKKFHCPNCDEEEDQ